MHITWHHFLNWFNPIIHGGFTYDKSLGETKAIIKVIRPPKLLVNLFFLLEFVFSPVDTFWNSIVIGRDGRSQKGSWCSRLNVNLYIFQIYTQGDLLFMILAIYIVLTQNLIERDISKTVLVRKNVASLFPQNEWVWNFGSFFIQ